MLEPRGWEYEDVLGELGRAEDEGREIEDEDR